MNFDPNTAVLDEPVTGKFDPTTAKPIDFDPSSAVPATPKEQLAALAPIVSQKNASPADDEAYKKAYEDYYDQNSMGQRFGQAVKAIPGEIGPAIWNMVKSGAQTMAPLFTQSAPDKGETLGGNLKAVGSGALAGMGSMAKMGMDLIGSAGEGVQNLLADYEKRFGGMGGEKLAAEHRQSAAEAALDRLKTFDTPAEQALANPYDPVTQARQHAMFAMGSMGGQAAAIPEIHGLSKAAQAGGDFIENGAYKAVGAAAKVTPAVIKTAETIGEIKSGMAAPVKAAGAVIGKTLSDWTGLTGNAANPYTWFSKAAAVQSGLFQAIKTGGDQLIATPLGQNAIDSIAAKAPDLIQEATMKNMIARDVVETAQAALKEAKDSGASTLSAAKALRQANNAETAANVYSHLINKGAGVAQWLQQNGAAGLPSKLATAVSGTIQGGILGGTLSAATAQPGDDKAIAQGISGGAFYGSVLSMLGAAGAASEVKGEESPSTLRQAADEKATVLHAPAVIDGVPHDVDALAENLSNAAKATVNAARQEGPETFNLKLTPMRKMDEQSGGMQLSIRPSDQTIMKVVAAHQPVESSMIPSAGYLPDEQMASIRFLKTPNVYHHYIMQDMPPEIFEQWMNGEGTEGSIGKYFNKFIRENVAFPHYEVRDQLFANPVSPAARTTGNPNPR